MTMSQQNVELARRAVEHLMATGEPPWDALDEEIEIHDHDILDAREYRSHAGWARWLEDAAWAERRVEPEEFIDADDDYVIVVMRVNATGQGSGVELERQDAAVFKVRAGKFVRIDWYNSKRHGLEAVGLSE